MLDITDNSYWMHWGYIRLIYVLNQSIEAILVDIPVAESIDVRDLHIHI